MFYFWLPFVASVIVVLLYERNRLAGALRGPGTPTAHAPDPPLVTPGLDPAKIERDLKQKAV